MVMSGWPANRSSCPSCFLLFWNFRDEIGIQDGILLKSCKNTIPASLQKGILEELHASHQGVEKTRLRVCTVIYWVEMNKDIKDFIANNYICQKYQANIYASSWNPYLPLAIYQCWFIQNGREWILVSCRSVQPKPIHMKTLLHLINSRYQKYEGNIWEMRYNGNPVHSQWSTVHKHGICRLLHKLQFYT